MTTISHLAITPINTFVSFSNSSFCVLHGNSVLKLPMCCAGHGPSVLGDLFSNQGCAPKAAANVVYDVVRWLRYSPSTVTTEGAYELLVSALQCPIKTTVFRAAERFARALPPPFTQSATTRAAMAWMVWPALESIMKVRWR